MRPLPGDVTDAYKPQSNISPHLPFTDVYQMVLVFQMRRFRNKNGHFRMHTYIKRNCENDIFTILNKLVLEMEMALRHH